MLTVSLQQAARIPLSRANAAEIAQSRQPPGAGQGGTTGGGAAADAPAERDSTTSSRSSETDAEKHARAQAALGYEDQKVSQSSGIGSVAPTVSPSRNDA